MHKKWRGNETRGTQAYWRDFEDKRGKVEEQVTFSGENLYPKIADSFNPIRKNTKSQYFDRSPEQENTLLQTVIGVRFRVKLPDPE